MSRCFPLKSIYPSCDNVRVFRETVLNSFESDTKKKKKNTTTNTMSPAGEHTFHIDCSGDPCQHQIASKISKGAELFHFSLTGIQRQVEFRVRSEEIRSLFLKEY